MSAGIRRVHELYCSASQLNDGPKTPSNWVNCCTKSWWLRWPSTWTSSPRSSTRRSTTIDFSATQTRSDNAALEAAALALGKPAPDAEALVMSQGIVQALVPDLAP